MLQTLRIRNLAVVDELSVEFQPGLNMITGETGAGKSILVGALSLLLGERADKSLIRTGESQCVVEASFGLRKTGPLDALLREAGLEPCEDGLLVLKRTITASGGANHVNGSPATLQVLKRIGDLLVDMHGPHDHQSLLDQRFQMDVLDAFGELGDERARYAKAYEALCELQARLKALDCDDQQVASQIDLYSFQVKELEQANLSVDEEAAVEREHLVATNAQGILEAASRACNSLTDAEGSVLDVLAGVQRDLEGLRKTLPDAEGWHAEAREAADRLRDLSRTISRCAQRVECDPARLQWLEDRISAYQKMKRKYGGSVVEALAILDRTRTRLQDLEGRGERIAAIGKEIARADKEVRERGRALGAARRRKAGALEKAITKELRTLGFPAGAFSVALSDAEPGPSGTDQVEYGFAPNVGEAMRPLRSIASSGEISRVMLALKAVLAEQDAIPVLVFDEIDANIGGEMGHAVGERLDRIAAHRQVLCITHLPQVAVHGAAHFAVAKEVRGSRTCTTIGRLDAKARVDELGRMLGGGKLAQEHAARMLGRK